MDKKDLLTALWDAVARQDVGAMEGFFAPEAEINWHCTNERFTLAEYLRANCEYPGDWAGAVERVEDLGDRAVCVARVWPADGSASFHCVAFYQFRAGKIIRADEYWGDDGPAPQWRLDKHIGTTIS